MNWRSVFLFAVVVSLAEICASAGLTFLFVRSGELQSRDLIVTTFFVSSAITFVGYLLFGRIQRDRPFLHVATAYLIALVISSVAVLLVLGSTTWSWSTTMESMWYLLCAVLGAAVGIKLQPQAYRASA